MTSIYLHYIPQGQRFLGTSLPPLTSRPFPADLGSLEVWRGIRITGGVFTNDILIGGAGNDGINGGIGHDWVFGDATNSYPAGYTDPVQYALDFMNQNRGRDVITGGAGNDVVLGGNAADRITLVPDASTATRAFGPPHRRRYQPSECKPCFASHKRQ